jgi:hypothetical protein
LLSIFLNIKFKFIGDKNQREVDSKDNNWSENYWFIEICTKKKYV